MLAGVLALTGGVSFAAPSPELLESLTTQILEQQTKTKSAKEVLDQLKPIFSHCATSHKDKAVQSLCKSFLEKQFASLEKEREKVQTGGVVFTKLGKLTDEEWLARVWLKEIAKKGWKRDKGEYKDMHRFDYYVAELTHYPFSIFLPHIDLSEEEKEKCRTYHQCIDEIFSKIRKYRPWTSSWDDLWHKTPLVIGSQVNVYNGSIEIEKHSLQGKSFEEQIEAIKVYNDARSPKEAQFLPYEDLIYFDEEGGMYTDESPQGLWLREKFQRVGNEVQSLKQANWKNLKKRYLGVGPLMQKALQEGNVKMLTAKGYTFIWLPSHPQEYYVIHINGDIGEATNMIRVFDLNNPDGTSSFLTQ